MSTNPNPSAFDQLFQEHQALKELLRQIDQALQAQDATIDEVSRLLAQLGDRLVHHFSSEEAGGYFSDALLRAPQLIARANELMAQHPKMCTRARDLIQPLELGKSPENWWQQTRQRFDAFREELLRHERGEDGLIQEAYNRDLGPAD